MSSEFRSRVESHPGAATLYLSGPLTSMAAWETLRRLERLAPGVTLLRVDLTAATLGDPGPITAVALLLERWRRGDAERRTRIELPPVHRRPSPRPLPAAFGPKAGIRRSVATPWRVCADPARS